MTLDTSTDVAEIQTKAMFWVALIVNATRDLVTPYLVVYFSYALVKGWLLGQINAEAFMGVAGSFIASWISGRQVAQAVTTAVKQNGSRTTDRSGDHQ